MAAAGRSARPAQGGDLVAAAERELRRRLTQDDRRLTHSLAVGACARTLAAAVPPADRSLLVAAALLHDLGYAADLVDTGYHPVDGARFLRREGWPGAVCALVAHHSGARYVAAARGLDGLLADFAFVEDPLSDALTAADQTIGVDGTPVPVEERMRDMLHRHGPDSPQARAHRRRAPYLRAAVARVEARLDGRRYPAGATPS